MEDDPVAPVWIKQDHLLGKSLFLGINYPFFLDAPATSAPPEDNAGNALPVFKPDCVFATHKHYYDRAQQVPDWARMPLAGGPTIGSVLTYEEYEYGQQLFQTPMWFVPRLPERAPMGWGA